MKKSIGWIIGFAAFVFGSCSDDASDDVGQSGNELLLEQQQTIETYLADNGITATQDGDIYYQVITENADGANPVRNDIIRIYYQIAVLDGAVIDERLADSGEPPVTYLFVGSSQVTENNLLLPVLDFSIANMRTGEEYEFYLPSAYAYGGYSLANTIPENAIIRARVQLIEIVSEAQLRAEEDQRIKDYLTENGLTGADSLTNGVYYARTQEGEEGGAEANNGSSVEVRYTGTLLDGTEFDSNVDSSTPLPFVVGTNGIIDGFNIGVAQMKLGEKGTIIMPSLEAYAQSQLAFPQEIILDLYQQRLINSSLGNDIPPFSPLRFDIELVSVN